MEITLKDGVLHITKESITGSKAPLYMLEHPSNENPSDVIVTYDHFGKTKKKSQIICSDQLALFTQLTSPASFKAKHKVSQQEIPAIARKYEDWLSTILFLDPMPTKMREYVFPSDKQILSDGSNLSGALYHLWGKDDHEFISPYKENRIEILQFIQSLPEQEIVNVSFLQEPRGRVMLQLTETFGGIEKNLDASILSDGTLRVLAIATAILSAQEGSLVIIEEIDNGVHPSRARHLLERIQIIAQRRNLQILLSTHNPAMLDALPDRAIPDVLFCYRDVKNGASRIVRLEQIPDYPELISQGSLGALVTSGMIERFAKYPKDEV
jgi:hypothetical protein